MVDVNLAEPPLPSIRAKSEADLKTIYDDLRQAIATGALPAGGRVPTERALASRFNAARNTVRKTMNRLSREGLIERHVGRGTFVAAATANGRAAAEEYTLAELLEARLLFEPNLPDLVVERVGPDDIEAMEASLAAMRAAESWAAFKEAKYGLHLAIAHAAKNRFIVSIFEQILASRRRAGWGRPGGHPMPVSAVREAAYRDNAGIVEALKAKDSAAAREAIRNYLLRTLSAAGTS